MLQIVKCYACLFSWKLFRWPSNFRHIALRSNHEFHIIDTSNDRYISPRCPENVSCLAKSNYYPPPTVYLVILWKPAQLNLRALLVQTSLIQCGDWNVSTGCGLINKERSRKLTSMVYWGIAPFVHIPYWNLFHKGHNAGVAEDP